MTYMDFEIAISIMSEKVDGHRYSNSKSFFLSQQAFVFSFEQHYKPGSVLDDHLS